MCGRFGFTMPRKSAEEVFGLAECEEYDPRPNIAPATPVLGIVPGGQGLAGRLFRWGLVPSWAKDPKMGARLINARGETVAEKPSFRTAFKRRRCLVPATCFYEWRKRASGGKQPYSLHRKDGAPFAMAGLWEFWEGHEGAFASLAIITTTANELLAPIHDRMPVILPPSEYTLWLDPASEPGKLQSLLVPCPSDTMAAAEVDRKLGNPRNQDPSLIRLPGV